MQSATSTLVAIQGERGSNSELAAREFLFTDFELLPCASFDDLFSAVAAGDAFRGMAPVDNSLAGSIHEVWDLFVRRPLPVVGEITLRIGHCLIGVPTSAISEIRRIYSHPQALAQCDVFLDSLDDIERHEVYDTAGAVAMIKQKGRTDEAAIAPAQAAADHNMKVLASAIETQRENYTRFMVIAKAPSHIETAEMKTSVVIRLDGSGRELGRVLGCLMDNGRELHRVETRKHMGDPWVVDAYVDFSGSVGEKAVGRALADLADIAVAMTLIGSYPQGRLAEPRLHPVDR